MVLMRGSGYVTSLTVLPMTRPGRDLPWTETTGSSDNGDDDRRRTKVTEYDPNGYLRRTVNPAGVDAGTGRPKFSYTSDAQVTSDPDAAKDATVYEYANNDPSLRTSKRLAWGDRGGQDSKRYRQDFGYDDRGRIETIDPPHEGTPNPDGRTTYSYFEPGWVKSAKDKYQTISYDYDGRGDQKLWESDGGRKMTRSYWPSGKLRTRIGRKGGESDLRRYGYEYDKNRSMSRMVDSGTNMDSSGDDRETGYGYDNADRQTKVNEKSFEADGDTRRGKDTALSYDKNGNVEVRRTDGRYDARGDNYAGGKTATFTYDSLDREQSMAVAAPDEPTGAPRPIGGIRVSAGSGSPTDRMRLGIRSSASSSLPMGG